jgi:tetratricopeptide (TPR) repeat protein
LIALLGAPAFAADLPEATAALPTESAKANASAEAASAALKAQGDALFRARNYVDALAAYEQAAQAFPDPRVLYNEARALQALGRNGEALSALTRFASVAPPELKAQLNGLETLMADLRSRVSEVVVRVNEPGAQVIFRDHVLGVTPLSGPLLLEAGQGSLRVVKDGYFSFAREVTLRGGGSASFDVTLGSVQRQARLVIKSRVPGALISIDDQRLAQAPTEALLLPGTHRVLAHREGYADASTQIIVDAGQNRVIDLEPIEQHPILKQWWFWTGVGIVTAAGTTAAVLIARDHRAASDGDFSPSAISAPLGRF